MFGGQTAVHAYGILHKATRVRTHNRGILGRPIDPRSPDRLPPFVDGQIATIAYVNGLTLITSNTNHFLGFKGMRVQSWTGAGGDRGYGGHETG